MFFNNKLVSFPSCVISFRSNKFSIIHISFCIFCTEFCRFFCCYWEYCIIALSYDCTWIKINFTAYFTINIKFTAIFDKAFCWRSSLRIAVVYCKLWISKFSVSYDLWISVTGSCFVSVNWEFCAVMNCNFTAGKEFHTDCFWVIVCIIFAVIKMKFVISVHWKNKAWWVNCNRKDTYVKFNWNRT